MCATSPALSVAGAAVVGRQRSRQAAFHQRELMVEIECAESNANRRPQQVGLMVPFYLEILGDALRSRRHNLAQADRARAGLRARVEQALLSEHSIERTWVDAILASVGDHGL